MAHLYSLIIDNYRGIKHLEAIFGNRKFVTLIGRGDSGKTTVLKAIASVLSPNWNLGFGDWDFYQSNTDEAIIIEAVVKDLPDELIKQTKFGLCLGFLKQDGVITYDIEDMPEEEAEKCEKVLTIRLKVTDNLEPKWTVISGPAMDVETEISANDRAKLKMYQVSDYIDNHFSYSKGSPLYSLFRQNIGDKSSPEKKIVEMVRKSYEAIKEKNSFEEFNEVRDTIVALAKGLGLNIEDLNTLIEFKENAYSESNITLHSEDIPYRLHGKGSKRLLSIAIQKGLIEDGGIVLIDELEQGLEPDRSRNLARLLKHTEKGQVFVTTHSREVITEASADNLLLVRKGTSSLYYFTKEYQSVLRRIPESVLSTRVICCEGSTEVGLIRAIDEYLQCKRGYSLAAQGIVYVNCCGGDKFYKDAICLKRIGIDACVIADDDTNENLEKAKREASANHISGILCDKGSSIEDMLFSYLPWDSIIEMLAYADHHHGRSKIYPILNYHDLEGIMAIQDVPEQMLVRSACAEKSKNNKDGGWYKRIDFGEFVGGMWLSNIDRIDPTCGLKKEFDNLMGWIGDDID